MFFLNVPSATLRLTPSVFSKCPFPEKKQIGDFDYILSWKSPLEFLGFLFYLWKIQKNKAVPQKLHKILLHPSELLRPKTKTAGSSIWCFSFLITPENSILFLLIPVNSTLNSSPCFFWNSPMTGVKVVYILFKFCWYRVCSSQVLNFQMLFYQQKLLF